jgi:hypothetical protein
MRKFGWEFMPAGPNEYKWLKFDDDWLVCAEGGTDAFYQDLIAAEAWCDG